MDSKPLTQEAAVIERLHCMDAAFKLPSSDQRETAIMDVLRNSPSTAGMPIGVDASLPLHLACRKKGSARLVSALLAAHRPGASELDKSLRLPLHWASERKAGAEVISLLLDAHAAGAAALDLDGLAPLHLAVSNGAPVSVIRLLLKAHPEAVRTLDARAHRAPLHYAAARRASPDVIAALLTADSSVSSIADGDGRLPIDLAHAHKARADVIEMLTCQTPGKVMSHGMTAAGGSMHQEQPIHRQSACIYNATLGACNAWELSLPTGPLEEAAAIFSRCDLQRCFTRFRASGTSHARLSPPRGVSERFFAVRAGAHSADVTSEDVSGTSPGVGRWSSDLVWISVDDAATHAQFQSIFRRCELEQHLASHVDCRHGLQMYSAFFVVRSRCDAPNFHVDYASGVGVNALTLITPMRPYPTPASGFHLLYEQVAEPNTAQGEDGPDGLIRRYEYVYGKAIVFGAGFKHSTEPGRSHGDEPQSYLCFTFGSDKPELWPLISQTIDSQSRVIARPDGALVKSRFGRELDNKASKHGTSRDNGETHGECLLE